LLFPISQTGEEKFLHYISYIYIYIYIYISKNTPLTANLSLQLFVSSVFTFNQINKSQELLGSLPNIWIINT